MSIRDYGQCIGVAAKKERSVSYTTGIRNHGVQTPVIRVVVVFFQYFVSIDAERRNSPTSNMVDHHRKIVASEVGK